MEVDSDPYSTARQSRRFGMPYGASQSMNYPAGGANMGPAATAGRSPLRQRLPILPDQSEHPSVSPAGQGSSSGFNPNRAEGAEAQDKLRDQIQQSTAARAQQSAAENAAGQREQAASIADYRQKRDTSPGAIANRETTQEATALGIDPSSSAKDVAAAASGKVGFDAQGMPTGGDTQQAGPSIPGAGPQPPASTPGNVQPNGNDVRTAVLQIQAGKDGQQRMATDQAYAAGAGVKTPFSPATAPQPSTTAPMTLRDGTTASAPPPAPVAAPMPPAPFAPAMKPKKPRPGYAGDDGADPNSQPA
jgi:hypothetical protein